MKVLFFFAVLCLAVGTGAVTVSSNFSPDPTEVDDSDTLLVPTLSFVSADFGCAENFDLTDVNVQISFDKQAVSCAAPASSGNTFLSEIFFSVGSSAGASVILINHGDYSGSDNIFPGVTVTYDQSGPPVGSVPTTGTFSPISGNLNDLNEVGLSSVTYTLTAEDNGAGDPLCMFSWAVIATANCVAGMGGDPHLFGFDGSFEDIKLAPGLVANVVSDRDLLVNVETTEFASISQMFTSFTGMMSFQTASGDVIVFDAISEESGVRVTVNGETTLCAEFPSSVTGASFSITHDDEARPVPLPVDHNINKVSQSFTVDFDRYSFGVFVVDEHFSAVHERVRFLDFTMSLHGSGHTPTGLLGRTIHASSERTATHTLEDFLVSDGILGSDFALNKFSLE